MKHSIWKSAVGILTAASLLFGCSHGGSKEGITGGAETENSTADYDTEKSTAAVSDQSSAYQMSSSTISTTLDGIQQFFIQDTEIAAVGYRVDNEKREISYYLTGWDHTWQEQEQIVLPFTSRDDILSCVGLCKDSQNHTYVMLSGSSGLESSGKSFYLVRTDADGRIELNCELTGVFPADAAVTGMTVTSNDGIYLGDTVGNVIYRLDSEGNCLDRYELEDAQLRTIVKSGAGTVYAVTRKNNRLYLSQCSGEGMSGSAGQLMPLEGSASVYQGSGMDFPVKTDEALLRYTLGEEEAVQAADWNTCGIDYRLIKTMGVMNGSDLTVILEAGEDSHSAEIYTFSRTDEAVEKQSITLATLQADRILKEQVVAYNRLHQDCPVVIKEYLYQMPLGDDNEADALRQLNTDLLAGTAGDILDVNSISHLTSLEYYVHQGLVENIGAWMEADEGIQVSDYIQNFLDANKVDGVLYNLAPSFYIRTLIGSRAVVGDRSVWTMEDAISLAQSYPDRALYAYQSKSQFLEDVCTYNGGFLVNEEEGTCQFDSDMFVQLLAYAGTLPDDAGSNSTVDGEDLLYRGKIPLFKADHFDVQMLDYRLVKQILKENIALIGFPVTDDSAVSGSVFDSEISLAMASTSKNKEAAWDFFRYLLSDEYQCNTNYSFPIKESVIQSVMEAQLTDEENAFSGEGNTISGWEIQYGYAAEEDIDAVNQFIHSVTRMAWSNEEIYTIISEEAQYYFAGEHTAEQAAQMIQDRVSLYLMERE